MTFDPTKLHVELEHKHARPLTACHWDPADRYVFFGAEDNLVHRFELATKTVVPLAAHDSWVRALGSSPDGQTLYSGGYDGRLAWWPAAAERPSPTRMIDAHDGWVRALAVSGDGRWIATCGNDRLVKLWDAAAGTLVHALAAHKSHVYNAAFSPDGSRLYSCDLHGNVLAWNLADATHSPLVVIAELHAYDTTFRADIGGARCIAVRGDGARVALGGITNVSNAFAGVGEAAVAIIDSAAGKLARLLKSKDKTQGAAWGLCAHPAGYWIALTGGGGGGWFFFWKDDSDQEFHRLRLKSDGRGLAVSPNHARFAVAHADAHLRLYSP